VREIFGYFGERGIRQLFLGNAVRVGPAQRPRLWASYQEVLRTLDWPGTPEGAVPELYVTQTPFVNAGAVGFKEPFIVLNTASLELLDEAERRFLLAHEVGHVMSGHVTYRTLAVLLLTVGLGALPIVVSAVLLPMQLALLEWYRKAELSSDRAGLLGVQEPRVAASTFLKLAGGTRPGMGGDDDPLDVDAFLAQAEEYTSAGGARDTVLRVLNTALRDHPFNTVRAGELQRWVRDGGYGVILAGEYDRRGERRRPARRRRARGRRLLRRSGTRHDVDPARVARARDGCLRGGVPRVGRRQRQQRPQLTPARGRPRRPRARRARLACRA
jgi:Zn-dependent protease with chaperone function